MPSHHEVRRDGGDGRIWTVGRGGEGYIIVSGIRIRVEVARMGW